MMKRKSAKDYSSPLLLYPGMVLRVGSSMQIVSPLKIKVKETVDKFVDNVPLIVGSAKNKASRAVCLKNRH